jgi:predicted secreted protein with PEFG-CTERM motif
MISKFFIFALIPLVLSIGFVPILSFGFNPIGKSDFPKDQYSMEFAIEEISCPPDMVLMIGSTGKPSCAPVESVDRLERFGWVVVQTGEKQKSSTMMYQDKHCSINDIFASGYCIPYNILGGKVTGADINTNDNSIIINIDALTDGTLTVSPTLSQQKGIFMVLVDGEEQTDVNIVGNNVIVKFPAGTKEIEIIGTFVIPEFGTIAAMILAVAIISIIAITAKSRLGITSL